MVGVGEFADPGAIGYVAGLFFAGLGAFGYWVNRFRRDNSSTALQEKTESAGSKYVSNMVDEHARLVAQLAQAHSDSVASAAKVGALTAEVEILREQVTEIKGLIQSLSDKLDLAHEELRLFERELIQKDGIVLKLQLEKDAAIGRAIAAEQHTKDLLKEQLEMGKATK